jgi:uncharacterized RDD family membrane protein YckC
MTQTVSEEAILGLDNVRLELPIAGAGSRALAAFIDYLVVGVLSVVLIVVAVTVGILADAPWWAVAFLVIGLFVIDYGYFAGIEISTRGQTLGKKALDLMVLDRRGGRATTAAFLIRNCVRLPDLLIGVPMMVSDSLARRLGDRLAGTVVVHGRAAEPEHGILRRMPRGWNAQNVALLEDFLRRAADLEAWRAERIARQLLAAIERDDPEMLAAIPPGGDSVPRLRRAVQAGEGA